MVALSKAALNRLRLAGFELIQSGRLTARQDFLALLVMGDTSQQCTRVEILNQSQG
jgi:hypothetical protein